MNTKVLSPAAALLVLLSHSFSAPVEITRDEAQKMASYDLEKIEEYGPDLAEKIIRVKFNYRSKSVEKLPDGKIKGTLRIWKYLPNTYRTDYIRSGSLDVIVPQEGVEWFMKIPPSETRATLLVYVRMPKDTKKGRAELLGREIKTDLKGSTIVW